MTSSADTGQGDNFFTSFEFPKAKRNNPPSNFREANVLCPFGVVKTKETVTDAVPPNSVKMSLLSNLDNSRYSATHTCIYTSLLKTVELSTYCTLTHTNSLTNASFLHRKTKQAYLFVPFSLAAKKKPTTKAQKNKTTPFWKTVERILDNLTCGQCGISGLGFNLQQWGQQSLQQVWLRVAFS